MTQGGVSKLEILAAENICGINNETSKKVMQVTENITPFKRKRRDRSQRGKAWMLDPLDSWGRGREARTCEKERVQNWRGRKNTQETNYYESEASMRSAMYDEMRYTSMRKKQDSLGSLGNGNLQGLGCSSNLKKCNWSTFETLLARNWTFCILINSPHP